MRESNGIWNYSISVLEYHGTGEKFFSFCVCLTIRCLKKPVKLLCATIIASEANYI